MASLFEQAEFKPYQDRWNTRLSIFSERRSYYTGAVYDTRWSMSSLGWLTRFVRPRLYQNIKPLYLPLFRAVNVDAGIVPGGWALPEDAPRTWQPAIDRLNAWSKWATDGVLYVDYGAQYGCSGLKVSDLRDSENRRVIVTPIDPTTFMLVYGQEYDDTPDIAIRIERRVDEMGEPFEYAEVTTPEMIRTFREGEPFGFDGREPEYANELEFVPFVEVQHIRSGEPLGECTFQRVIPMLTELNEHASYLSDIVRKHNEPQWAAFGAEPQDLEKSGDSVWFFDRDNARVEALLAAVDIPGMLEFVREIKSSVESGLPELAFDELRRKDQIATATLELQLMELVLKIKRIRPNYDAGLVEAWRMAGRAAKSLGLSAVAVLDDEQLAIDDERPVLPLDPETAVRIELQSLALKREKSIGFSEGVE